MRSPYNIPANRDSSRQHRFAFVLGFPTLGVVLGAVIGYWYSRLSLSYYKLPLIRAARLRSAELAPWCVAIGVIIGLLIGLYCERLSGRGERRTAIILLTVIVAALAMMKFIHGDIF